MNWLDVVLIALTLTYALNGYLRGFVSSACTALGLIIGGGLAIIAAPVVIRPEQPTAGTSALAIAMVVIVALLGAAMGSVIGRAVRAEMQPSRLTTLDSLGGSALTAVATLVIAWAVGYSATSSQVPFLSDQARGSTVLKGVDRALPAQAESMVSAFTDLLDTSFFPRYIDPFDDETIIAVDPPDDTILSAEAVRSVRSRVAKISGQAEPCSRGLEGSGFVYAQDRIMTNAHVVAGVDDPRVEIDGRTLNADVVGFNADLDVAVLAVNGLDLTPLEFDETAGPGDDAAVMGFPENGPFDERAARIRSQERLRGPDIYNEGVVERETFALRSMVRPGNSGGPLIGENGDVIGVIFAASLRDSDTGYALTAEQVRAEADAGERSTSRVSTGGCA